MSAVREGGTISTGDPGEPSLSDDLGAGQTDTEEKEQNRQACRQESPTCVRNCSHCGWLGCGGEAGKKKHRRSK